VVNLALVERHFSAQSDLLVIFWVRFKRRFTNGADQPKHLNLQLSGSIIIPKMKAWQIIALSSPDFINAISICANKRRPFQKSQNQTVGNLHLVMPSSKFIVLK